MVEPEEKTLNKAKISKLAITSLILGIFGPLLGLYSFVIVAIVDVYLMPVSPWFLYPFDSLVIGYLASWLPAYLIGKDALYKITFSNGFLRGIGYAKVGVKAAIVWAVLLPVFILMVIIVGQKTMQVSPRLICGSNLAGLGKALCIYAEKYGSYPEADKWCDILLHEGDATEKIFRCPRNKKAACSFSMNPNCEPNSPPDTVLLFESKGGWNSFGGSELFTDENHKREGGNVLFNDCHAKFIKTDPNGVPLEELNWSDKN